jgi:DNA-binding beta-propeller fold protein YncE
VPGGREAALFGVLATPGPMRDETVNGGVERQYSLVALAPDFLDVRAIWQLSERPSAVALAPDGGRAYLLGGSGMGRQARDVSCLDLGSGQLTHRWPLPDGCFAMALSPVGKLYVADSLGDRLWRVDVRRNVFLGDIPLPGAPLTLAARPPW